MSTETVIPERGTKAFAEYCAGVEWECSHGARVEWQWLDTDRKDWWFPATKPGWLWREQNYRVKPGLHPIDQWRAMSEVEREGKVLEHRRDGKTNWCTSREETEDYPLIRRGYTFRIRELTLAERNAAVRDQWEAMEETDDAAIRESVDGTRMTWECRGGDSEWRRAASGAIARWFEDLEYRLVPAPEPPKPRYVPWTRETCPLGAVVRNKSGERSVIASVIHPRGYLEPVVHAYAFGSITFERALERWTMDDGTPCGTEVTA